MTAPLSREQAETAVAAAVAQRDTIQANLLDLDGSFGRRLLAGAQLSGQTQQSWAAATARQTRLWELYAAYSAVVDRAAEILARARKPAALAELSTLLSGDSIRLTGAVSPLAQRDLTGSTTMALTPDAAVREMKRAFAEIASLVTAAEQIWNELADQVQDLADRLREAELQTSGIDDDTFRAALATAGTSLAQLRDLLNRDPLAMWGAGQVDGEPLARLRQQVAGVLTRAAELSRLRADADARIAAATAELSGARAAWQDAMAARERAMAKIAVQLPGAPEIASLVGRVAALGELKTAGRWSRLAAELELIGKQTAAAAMACREMEREALALVDRRNELRGLLDAYRARAARLGSAEDSGLQAGYEQARKLLWTAPCDLAAAADAVTGYQQAVLGISGRG
ncbi:MAG: hypothetical protein ABJB47_04070 [Actinomycetota bacterium]